MIERQLHASIKELIFFRLFCLFVKHFTITILTFCLSLSQHDLKMTLYQCQKMQQFVICVNRKNLIEFEIVCGVLESPNLDK